MGAPIWGVLVTAVSIVATAFGTYFIARRQGKRDYSHDLAEMLQALDVTNKQLREDLARKEKEIAQKEDDVKRVTIHRDQLMVENVELMKRVVRMRNGNDHAHQGG